MSAHNVGPLLEQCQSVAAHLNRAILGKPECVEMVMVALLCHGHVLLEDIPGVGKTTLCLALAQALDASFARIQCTPDLLPSDITGSTIYLNHSSEFQFRPGPIHHQIILADELNRAAPKTQSAMLECMEERQVTVDGKTYPLPHPFIVFATQNPVELQGTYPLPEAQLDRFFLHLSLGYPALEHEVAMLEGARRSSLSNRSAEALNKSVPLLTPQQLLEIHLHLEQIHCSQALKNYLVKIVRQTRQTPGIVLGASPRGTLALYAASRARAFLQGRKYVLPDDIQALVVPVLGHRLAGKGLSRGAAHLAAKAAMENIDVPIE